VANYYIGSSTHHGTTFWYVDEKSARRIDTDVVIEVPSGADPWECIKSKFPDLHFEDMKFAPGEYHPRIARPEVRFGEMASSYFIADPPHPDNQLNKVLIETARGQLAALREQLEEIFRTVHSIEKNFNVYGHDIRNLLILAATEVEAHWKGILKANGVVGVNTNDYVKLLKAMRLDEYEVTLPFYPWLAPISPFKGWMTTAPTQSLQWYEAYNAVKHDRETLFERGKLIHAIEAVCACAIIIIAQFGYGLHDREQSRFFDLLKRPQWDSTEVYVLVGQNRKPIPYPF
jgi:hypothetical protein